MKLFRSLGAVALVVTLSACGGGGGATAPQATTSTQTPTQSQTQSTTPATLTAAPGMSEVIVSWPQVDGAVSYNAYWATESGVTTATGAKITGVTTPFTHTGLTDGVGYYYIVTAVMADGSETQPWEEAGTVAGSCH